MEEKILSTTSHFRGRLLQLDVLEVELADGGKAQREVVHHPHAVCAAVLTTEGEWALVEQYRVPAAQLLIEVPAGKIDPGENPDEAILRELEEEVGYQQGELIRLAEFWSTPGFCTERMTCYLARNAVLSSNRPDQGEFLEVLRIPAAEGLAWINSGRICDSKSITALLLGARHLGL